ncbi:hypothetical protein EMIT0P43_140081 [Pseudomonas jessenii]
MSYEFHNSTHVSQALMLVLRNKNNEKKISDPFCVGFVCSCRFRAGQGVQGVALRR